MRSLATQSPVCSARGIRSKSDENGLVSETSLGDIILMMRCILFPWVNNPGKATVLPKHEKATWKKRKGQGGSRMNTVGGLETTRDSSSRRSEESI